MNFPLRKNSVRLPPSPAVRPAIAALEHQLCPKTFELEAARALRRAAALHAKGHSSRAIALLERLSGTLECFGDSKFAFKASVLTSLAELYLERGGADQAFRYSSQLLSLCGERRRQHPEAAPLESQQFKGFCLIARALRAMNEPAEAISYLDTGLSGWREGGKSYRAAGAAALMEEMALCYQAREREGISPLYHRWMDEAAELLSRCAKVPELVSEASQELLGLTLRKVETMLRCCGEKQHKLFVPIIISDAESAHSIAQRSPHLAEAQMLRASIVFALACCAAHDDDRACQAITSVKGRNLEGELGSRYRLVLCAIPGALRMGERYADVLFRERASVEEKTRFAQKLQAMTSELSMLFKRFRRAAHFKRLKRVERTLFFMEHE